MRKKSMAILIAFLGLIFSYSSFAVNYNVQANMYTNFKKSLRDSGYHLEQSYIGQSQSDANTLRNSCGTMSMLAIHSYFNYRDYHYTDSFSKSHPSVLSAIIRIYDEQYYRNPSTYY